MESKKEIKRKDLTYEEFERVLEYFRILIKWDRELKEKDLEINEKS